jgi:hypothetical protein
MISKVRPRVPREDGNTGSGQSETGEYRVQLGVLVSHVRAEVVACQERVGPAVLGQCVAPLGPTRADARWSPRAPVAGRT